MPKIVSRLLGLMPKGALKNPLLAGSIIVFSGNMLTNVINYVFHLSMGRMLGPVDYGILESLISVFYLLGIPAGAFSLTIVKHVSLYKGEERWGAIGKFFKRLNQGMIKFGIVGFLIYLLLTPWLKNFLYLETAWPLLIVGLTTLLGLFVGVNHAFLRGFLRFAANSLSGAFEMIMRLVLAVVLVFIGFRYTGAVLATLVATILGYLLSFWLVKDGIKRVDEREALGRNNMIRFFLPTLFSSMALTSLFTTDIFLARHFLPEFEAGLYAALATLGKSIFFLTVSISTVMFPLISEAKAKEKSYNNIFWQSFGLVFLGCVSMTILYFIFPEIIVGLLYGPKFLIASKDLGLFAIFLSLYGLTSLVVDFFLSIGKLKIVIFPVMAAVSQIILIFFFHSSVRQLVINSIFVLVFLLSGLLVYFFLYKSPRYAKVKSFYTKNGETVN